MPVGDGFVQIAPIVSALLGAAGFGVTATIAVAGETETTAHLINLSGSVLVNQGEKFVHGHARMPLLPGNVIYTLDKSAVTIVFEPPAGEGDAAQALSPCEINLPENSSTFLADLEQGCEQAILHATDGVEESARIPAASDSAEPDRIDAAVIQCALFDCVDESSTQ